VLAAFSVVVNGEGEGEKLDEDKMGKIRASMQIIEQTGRSLPTDPLDTEHVLNIHTSLVIAKSIIWNFLSSRQQEQFFPEETRVEGPQE